VVERERELKAIKRCLASARQQLGHLLLIEGPAGIGKTRLLAEACLLARRRKYRVFAARGGELERGFAFGVVRQLFEPLVAEADIGERRTILGGAARLAEPLFGLAASTAEPAADINSRRLHGLYWLCANLASDAPALIAVDDAHWSDDPSLRFLDYLARRLDGLGVVLLVAHRPGEADDKVELLRQLAAEPDATVLRPVALSDQAIAVLAEDVFGHAPDDGFAATCGRATGGNPFLVWELMRSVAKDGGQATADAAARVAALGPETVARSVALRLGRLSASAGRLCSALAVLGGEAELRHVSALANAPQNAALADVDALVASGIVESNDTVCFVHPIVRAAVYSALPAGERERSHAAAARLLAADSRPSEEVAAHLMLLHLDRSSWIADTLLAAGLDAVARGAPDAAIPFLRRALDQPPRPATHLDVLLALGSAEASVGHPDAPQHLHAALEHLEEPSKRASATVALMHALAISGRFTEALRAVDETIESVAPRDRETALGLEAILGGAVKVSDERTPLSPRWDRYGPINGDTPGERLLLGEVAWEQAFAGGTADDVAESALKSLSEAILLGHVYQPPFFQAAYLMTICDRFASAEDALHEALTAAHAVGSALSTAIAESWLAYLALRRGRIAGAEAHARASIDLGAIIGYADVFTPSRIHLIHVLVERGALTEAEDVFDSTQLPSDMPHGVAWRMSIEGRASLRLAQGRPTEALVDLYALRDLEAGRRVPNPAVCPWRSQAALALHALGEAGEARRLADEEVALARSFGAPRATGIALRASGLVLGGSDGVTRLQEAAEVLEHSGAELEHARALTDLGAVIRRGGRRFDAREPLRHGFARARACGASALSARAHEELLASGARPRRVSLRGVDSLTASERRVAEMAARGMGNVEIAQALFVSRKTVETHLGHTYTKLGISSRNQLAPALEETIVAAGSTAAELARG
jgi:DNA-binding CsgD family transcriptional regulator